jgi:2-methylisocitrate lyase-like PEP mutase family enzyme
MNEAAARFLDLHVPGRPLLLPNPWDVGSAKLLVSLGFAALATTSSGFAGTLGRPDGQVTCDEVLTHARALVAAVGVPVSADLENGFADDPAGVRDAVRAAAETGLAGCSVEDWSGTELYDVSLATERIAAAAGSGVVLTARAENHIRGNPDLRDTIRRLQAYEQAGADCLYAPGLVSLDDIRAVVSSVGAPVNVLARPGMAPVAELAAAGVARISVGGAFAQAALGALTRAGRELLEAGTYGFLEEAAAGQRQAAQAWSQE